MIDETEQKINEKELKQETVLLQRNHAMRSWSFRFNVRRQQPQFLLKENFTSRSPLL